MRIEGLSNLSSDLDKNFEDILKDLKINTSTVVGTINDLSTGLETYIGATNAGIDTWLKTFTPTLHSELVGVEQLTAANTTAIPDKNKLEEAASKMIYYYDNLSAQEAEKLGTITGAVQQETQKVANAIQTYTANKVTMENGANAMSAIKDGFSSITTGIPQQTATAIATNIDRVIEAIKAEDVKINQATPSHMASTSYINPYGTSNSIVNSAISANSGSGKYDYMFDSGGKKSSSSSQNIISSSNIITSSSSNKNPNSTRATNALEKVIEIAVKWQSQIGFNKKQQALDAILNGQYINAGGASSAIQSYVNTWNEFRSLYGQAKIRSAINKALNGSLKSQKSKYGLHTYAKGTLSALPGLAQIFEEGPEIITTKKGTFMPFSGGEGVVPADITKGLMELGIAMQDGKMDANINRVISTVDNGLGSIKDSVDSLVKPINKIPEEIKASRDVIKESIQFNKLADVQTREVDKKEIKEYSGYIRTAYGSLKPIESNVEMFSSGDELNNMLQDNINALKSYYDELSASATNMINNSGSNNITISSLITVNGNADSETVDKIKQVAIDLTKNKRFLNNIVSYVSQEQAKDLRKSGRSM